MHTLQVVEDDMHQRVADMRPDTLEANLNSSSDSLDKISCLIDQVARWLDLPEGEKVDLMVSVMEAATNAIHHGNQEDEARQIHIRMQLEPSQVTVWVRDEGRGFDSESVPDPCDPQNLMKASGRGILMMQAFMDQVEFYPLGEGMMVKMTKRFLPARRPGIQRPICAG